VSSVLARESRRFLHVISPFLFPPPKICRATSGVRSRDSSSPHRRRSSPDSHHKSGREEEREKRRRIVDIAAVAFHVVRVPRGSRWHHNDEFSQRGVSEARFESRAGRFAFVCARYCAILMTCDACDRDARITGAGVNDDVGGGRMRRLHPKRDPPRRPLRSIDRS